MYKDPNSDSNVFSQTPSKNNGGSNGINKHVMRRTSDNDTNAAVAGNGLYNKTMETLREQVKTLEKELREKYDEEKVEKTV